MPDDLRIRIDELRKRMEAGEDFEVIDTRNPQVWAESDVMLPRISSALHSRDAPAGFLPRDIEWPWRVAGVLLLTKTIHTSPQEL
jgi:hypothetical protein